MYEYLKGILAYIYPTAIVVDVHGVGYLVQTANPFSFADMLHKEVSVYCYQAVREDAITLYGFRDVEEKQLFLKLISVSGIGPKSALAILANKDSAGLIQAIESDDVTYLVKFPGVGKKTAGQLVLDLKGKLSDIVAVDHSQVSVSEHHILEDTKEALLGLGYSNKEIQKIWPLLEKESITDTAEALRIAFKLLLTTKK